MDDHPVAAAMNAGLEPQAWHDAFVLFGTSCAALLGLFYVAISLHIDELQEHRLELNRAQAGLHALLVGLVISVLVLIPGQPLTWLGIELIAVEVGFLIIALPAGRQGVAGVKLPAIWWMNSAVSLLSIVLVMLAGVSLIVGQGPGLFLVVPTLLVILLLASYFGWSVLMVGMGKRRTKR